MAKLGCFNRLTVTKQVNFGLFLDGGEELGEVLLPKRFVPKSAVEGDELEVFLYLDSEDRPIATTEKPKITLGSFAALKCIDVNRSGAFLDWGLPKDLFVPYNEQKPRMEVGKRYVVYLYLDNTDRLAASGKLRKYVSDEAKGLSNGQEVDIIIAEKTDLGFKAIINNKFFGMLFFDDAKGADFHIGKRSTAYIKRVRPDGKVDLCMSPQGYVTIDSLTDKIIKLLKENDGMMAVSDKSSPELIKRLFGCSKREFKMAIGKLYKARQINLDKQKIELAKKKK